MCIGAENGWITRNQAYNRILKTLKFFLTKVEHKNGFFYHFLNMEDGSREWNCEISSIDTALFIAGALTAGEYFKRTEIDETARALYSRINWKWMLNGKNILCMGWKPEEGFIPYYWNTLNEALILYMLAIGAPQNSILPGTWDAWERPSANYGSNKFFYCPTGSLFVYQYSHAFIDFRQKKDSYMNYWKNSIKATISNRQFCIDRSNQYKGYGTYSWGLSACIGPYGYKGYGGGPGNPLHDGTIAPSAAAGALPFLPDVCYKTLKAFYHHQELDLYGKYGFFNGFNMDKKWVSNEFLGIDQGITLLMIENYLTDFVWKYFMLNPAAKKWIAACRIMPDD